MKLSMVGPIMIALLAVTACEKMARGRSDSNAPVAVRSPQPEQAAPSGAAGDGSTQTFFSVASSAPGAATSTASTGTDSTAPPMIIRTGDASIEVDSLDVGMAAVRTLARRVGGYVANTSMQAGNEQSHSATLQLKIPAAHFDEALAGLKPIGKVESTSVTAEDVGEEYVDVSARMDNGRRLEKRLLDLLATRTGKLSDVLEVETELARVRGEIDSAEGRLRYLRAHVAMSTLSVTVHEPVPIVGEQGSGGVIAESFREMWRNFVSFIAGFIALLGFLVPLVVVLGAIVYGLVTISRRMKRPVPGGTGETAS